MRRPLFSLLLWGLCTLAYAQPDFLVDVDWLAEHIEDHKLVVLEVHYHPHRYYVHRWTCPGSSQRSQSR